MIGVVIHINGNIIRELRAKRISGGKNLDDINTYEMTGFSNITHRYGDGAEALAKKMLDAYLEGK